MPGYCRSEITRHVSDMKLLCMRVCTCAFYLCMHAPECGADAIPQAPSLILFWTLSVTEFARQACWSSSSRFLSISISSALGLQARTTMLGFAYAGSRD